MINIAKEKIRRQMEVNEGNNKSRKRGNKETVEIKEKTKNAKMDCDSSKNGNIGGSL